MPRQREGDQPLPKPGREDVQNVLIAAIRARKELGIERYGSPLMTHNGRDALKDAWEEAVDLAAYLTQARLEQADTREAVELLDRWLAAHPDKPGGALIAKARELLTGTPQPKVRFHLSGYDCGHPACPKSHPSKHEVC